MKTILLTTTLCHLPLFILAQNLTREMLNAQKVEHAILFRLEKIGETKRLTYEIDPRDAVLSEKNTSRSKIVTREIDNGARLSVAATSTSFNILFDFYNPLKYGYRIQSKETESPSAVAFEKFYSELWDLATKVNPTVEGLGSSNENVSTTLTRLFERNYYSYRYADDIQKGELEISRLQSNELIDWALWFYNNYQKGSNSTAVADLSQKYMHIEKYIYSKLEPELTRQLTGNSNTTLYYESYLFQLFDELGATLTAADFNKKIDQIKEALKKLKGYNDNALSVCRQIESINFKTTSIPPAEEYFIDYTKSKRTAYLEKARTIINKRADLLVEFQDLVANISKDFLPSLAAQNVTKIYVESVDIGKLDEIRIQLIESNFVVENGKLKRHKDNIYSFDLLVSEYSSVLAEFGLGSAFFPPIDAPNYSSSNNTVVKTTTKFFYTPMASLNLIPNIGKGQAFWMMQVGVGSSIDKPTIALGTGVRVYNIRESVFRNFSISIGCLGVFVRRLETLQEGSIASQDDVDQDLTYAINFRPYLALALNF